MTHFIPEYIRTLVPYIPGKPIEETQREFRIRKVIKMASNENPLGPSPKAIKAIQRSLKDLHRYPDAGGFRLKKSLVTYLGIPSASWLILGNGSNEVIDQLVRTYCVPGDAIVSPRASFVAYKICAQIHGVQSLEVPLDLNLEFQVEELLSCVRKNEKVRILFIANPNNPTGTYLNSSKLSQLMKGLCLIRGGSVLLVLDYAYWEYVTAPDLPNPCQVLKKYPNCIVLRTFSKIYGLAGLRIGYGIASPEIISNLEKVRQPFNTNLLALVGAEAALADSAFVKKSKKVNEQGMMFWEMNLNQKQIPYWKSQGNFLLIDTQTGLGKSGLEVYHECLPLGVIFRPVMNYGLSHALRISIGTEEENVRAVKVIGLKKPKLVRKKK